MTKKLTVSISLIAALCLILSTLYAVLLIRTSPHVSFAVNDTLPDGGGKQARIILLGGQSNAAGWSRDDYLKKNVSPEKYAEYERGYDNIYINFNATGTNLSEGFVKSGTRQGKAGGFFGPELGIAERLHELYPDETIFIIKCAWGGTNLYEQWLSPSGKGGTGDLYRQFVDYVKGSIDYLQKKNYDVEIEAMCWMQGESDALDEKNASDYGENLKNFIADIRKEFNAYASDDGIAFIDAFIADFPTYWVHYDLVNQGKQTVASLSSINALVDTIGAGLTCSAEPEGSPDMAHYDSTSQIKLGNLFADEVSRFFD